MVYVTATAWDPLTTKLEPLANRTLAGGVGYVDERSIDVKLTDQQIIVLALLADKIHDAVGGCIRGYAGSGFRSSHFMVDLQIDD